MTKTLIIYVQDDGSLYCHCPEDNYHYVVKDWTLFIKNAVAFGEVDDFTIFVYMD